MRVVVAAASVAGGSVCERVEAMRDQAVDDGVAEGVVLLASFNQICFTVFMKLYHI